MKNLIGGIYQIKEKLGHGQFGNVYKGQHKDTLELVAIKLMSLQKFKQTSILQKLMENEIKILQSISHPNIIKLFGYGNQGDFKYLIYEYCNGGDLEELILSKKRPVGSNFLLKLFTQIISGYEELAKHNILHRDLKPQNILLHNNIIKIADFGFSKAHNTEEEMTQTLLGSPLYMAPEVLFGYPYNQQADVWSLGICLYELLFGKCPIQGKTKVELVNRMARLKDQPIQIPSTANIDSTIKYLLEKMLIFEANKRCTWQELGKWKTQIEAKISDQQLQSVTNKTLKINQNMQRMQDVTEKKLLQQFHKC